MNRPAHITTGAPANAPGKPNTDDRTHPNYHASCGRVRTASGGRKRHIPMQP
jgi:hypothetical protein